MRFAVLVFLTMNSATQAHHTEWTEEMRLLTGFTMNSVTQPAHTEWTEEMRSLTRGMGVAV
jgi:hypothetical protein